MLSPEFCNATSVRKEIGALNKCGVLAEKVKAVGVAKKELVESFLKAVESVPEGTEEAKKIPASVIKLYNEIVEGVDPSPEEQEKLKAAKTKKKDAKPRGPSNEAKALEIFTESFKAGLDDAAIKAKMTEYFKPYYEARGKGDQPDFIEKRVGIYTNIAKKQYFAAHPDEAPKKEEKPPKKETAKKDAAKDEKAATGEEEAPTEG